jgi:flagellar hook-basal body complex protein FliE
VDGALKEADQSVRDLAVGKRHDLHEIMIATEKADVSFKFLMQIRNKLLEAYQEIMRMPL